MIEKYFSFNGKEYYVTGNVEIENDPDHGSCAYVEDSRVEVWDDQQKGFVELPYNAETKVIHRIADEKLCDLPEEPDFDDHDE